MQRAGDPWQSWDAGRVWAALACWGCCLAHGHAPMSCNPDELPQAEGSRSVMTDSLTAVADTRQDVERAIAGVLCKDKQARKPRAAEIRGLIVAICRLGPPTKGLVPHPHDVERRRRGEPISPREIGWVEYEAMHWADVAQRLHLEDWEDARRRARSLCVALSFELGFRGQYRWE